MGKALVGEVEAKKHERREQSELEHDALLRPIEGKPCVGNRGSFARVDIGFL